MSAFEHFGHCIASEGIMCRKQMQHVLFKSLFAKQPKVRSQEVLCLPSHQGCCEAVCWYVGCRFASFCVSKSLENIAQRLEHCTKKHAAAAPLHPAFARVSRF